MIAAYLQAFKISTYISTLPVYTTVPGMSRDLSRGPGNSVPLEIGGIPPFVEGYLEGRIPRGIQNLHQSTTFLVSTVMSGVDAATLDPSL